MLKHSPGRIEQSFTVRGVKAGHVVHCGLFRDYPGLPPGPTPRSEHVGADDEPGGPSACGIALDDAAPGATTSFAWIIADDTVLIENPAWSWRPGSIFLGLNGALTQEERVSGLSTRMGVATSPTMMRCDRAEVFRDLSNPLASAAATDFPRF